MLSAAVVTGALRVNKKSKSSQSVIHLKDIHPHIFLLNFKFLTKNYILDILMICSKVLLSAKFIICDCHWKIELWKIHKSGRIVDRHSRQKQILGMPSNHSKSE